MEEQIKKALLLKGFSESEILNNANLINAIIDETILLSIKGMYYPYGVECVAGAFISDAKNLEDGYYNKIFVVI